MRAMSPKGDICAKEVEKINGQQQAEQKAAQRTEYRGSRHDPRDHADRCDRYEQHGPQKPDPGTRV